MKCYVCGADKPALFMREARLLDEESSRDNCLVYTVYEMRVCPACSGKDVHPPKEIVRSKAA